MGFPKGFIKSQKNGDQYKQIGNSVPINVVTAIADQIIKQKLLDDKFKHKYDQLNNFMFNDHQSI